MTSLEVAPHVLDQSEPATPIVSVSRLTKRYVAGGPPALLAVDLTVRRGEFVTILGASGCGKSTLLSLVGGLIAPTEGTLSVTARKTASMFQDPTLMPWLTARENVELALRLRGVARSRRRAEAESLLADVRLQGKGDVRPHELSGGMRQRVALARALAQGADLLLMDEPFGALDAMTRDAMHDVLEGIWREHGLTVMFVTHNVREAVRLGDRTVLLSSSPGWVKAELDNSLPRPRRIDSPEVTARAALLNDALQEEVSRHVG